jgi:sugar-specific transcriptional regulator TrmB
MVSAPSMRPLAALGISELEERVYLALLDRPDASLPELSHGAALAPRKLQRVLDGLATKGLLTSTDSRPRRYIPASPDIAMEALVLRQQDAPRSGDQDSHVSAKEPPISAHSNLSIPFSRMASNSDSR